MKLTKEQLVKIIKEELNVAEAYGDPEPRPSPESAWNAARDALLKFKQANFKHLEPLEKELSELLGNISEAHGGVVGNYKVQIQELERKLEKLLKKGTGV